MRLVPVCCGVVGMFLWIITVIFIHFHSERCGHLVPVVEQQLQAASRTLNSDPPPWVSRRTARENGKKREVVLLGDRVVVTGCTRKWRHVASRLVRDLRQKGGYTGQVVVIDMDQWSEQDPLNAESFDRRTVIVQSSQLLSNMSRVPPPPCEGLDWKKTWVMDSLAPWEIPKRRKAWDAYYNKVSVFSEYFRQWNRVLWLDAGIQVQRPSVNKLFDEIDSAGFILASPDNWPDLRITLRSQFWSACDPDLFAQLGREFDLETKPYQSAVLLFDTSLIEPFTVQDLTYLFTRFHQIAKGDQGLLSAYFTRMRVMRALPYRLESNEVPYDIRRRFHTEAANNLYILNAWYANVNFSRPEEDSKS